jgi:hypothetical protein
VEEEEEREDIVSWGTHEGLVEIVCRLRYGDVDGTSRPDWMPWQIILMSSRMN